MVLYLTSQKIKENDCQDLGLKLLPTRYRNNRTTMSPTVTEHQKSLDGCWGEPSPIGGTSIAHGWCELDGFGTFEKISGN